MKCSECGRELKKDSKFCDWCGAAYKQKEQDEYKSTLNARLLMGGIILSILITLIITGLAGVLGIPLLFGGLFLPFFWQIKKHQKDRGD